MRALFARANLGRSSATRFHSGLLHLLCSKSVASPHLHASSIVVRSLSSATEVPHSSLSPKQQQQKQQQHQHQQPAAAAVGAPHDLSDALKKTRSWRRIVRLIREMDPALLNAANCTMALYCVSNVAVKTGSRLSEADVRELLDLVEAKAGEFDEQQVMRVLWSIAKLELMPAASTMDALSTAITRLLHRMDASTVTSLYLAYAKLQCESPSVLYQRASELEASFSEINLYQLRLEHERYLVMGKELLPPGTLLSRIQAINVFSFELNYSITKAETWEEIAELVRRASATDISGVNCSTALHRIASFSSSKNRETRPTAMNLVHLLTLLEAKVDDFKAQNLSSTLLSLAKLGLVPSPSLMDALMSTILRLDGKFNAQSVSNSMYALVKLGHTPPVQVMTVLYAAIEQSAGDFIPQNVANTTWALAKIGFTRSFSSNSSLLLAIERMAGEYTSQNVANILWAIAKLHIKPPASLMDAMSLAIERLAKSFNQQEVANTLWALSELKREPPSALIQRASSLASVFNVIELMQIHRAHRKGKALGWRNLPSEHLAAKGVEASRKLFESKKARLHES